MTTTNINAPTKAAFVRSLPLTIPAAEVVAKATEIGIPNLVETYVHEIRSKMRKNGIGGGKRGRQRKTTAVTTIAKNKRIGVSHTKTPARAARTGRVGRVSRVGTGPMTNVTADILGIAGKVGGLKTLLTNVQTLITTHETILGV